MSKITILHNPRCSKSRQTLQLLNDQQADVEVIEYLKTPLNAEALTAIKEKLGIDSYLEMMRPKEAEFKSQGLGKGSSEDELLNAMVNVPKLMERPIVVVGNQARIGRPPEQVLELFND